MTMLKVYLLALLVLMLKIVDEPSEASLIQKHPFTESVEDKDPRIDDVDPIDEAEKAGQETSSKNEQSESTEMKDNKNIQNPLLINGSLKNVHGDSFSSEDGHYDGGARHGAHSNSEKQNVDSEVFFKPDDIDDKEDKKAPLNIHEDTEIIYKILQLLKDPLMKQAAKQNTTKEDSAVEGTETENIDRNEAKHTESGSTNDQTHPANKNFHNPSDFENASADVAENEKETIIPEEEVTYDINDEFKADVANDDQAGENETSSQETSECPNCGKNGLLEEDLKLIRVKMFKDVLAQKLRIEQDVSGVAEDQASVRATSSVPKLPGTILEETFKENARELEKDQFYARDEEVIISGDDMGDDCLRGNAMGCYSFELKKKIKWAVADAQLWFYKTRDFNDINGQIITVSELKRTNGQEDLAGTVLFRQTMYNKNGWINVNVTEALLETLNQKSNVQMMSIQCSTCWTTNQTELFGAHLGYKPLLVVKYASNNNLVARTKRSATCDPATNCCRRDLVINFHDISMVEIYEPRNLSIGYCFGSCNDIGQYTYNHTQLKQHMRYSSVYANDRTMNQQLRPCCVPLILKDAFLMTIENNTIERKVIPKVIVETCGCM